MKLIATLLIALGTFLMPIDTPKCDHVFSTPINARGPAPGPDGVTLAICIADGWKCYKCGKAQEAK